MIGFRLEQQCARLVECSLKVLLTKSTGWLLCLSVLEVQFDDYFVGKRLLYLQRRVLRILLDRVNRQRGYCLQDLVRRGRWDFREVFEAQNRDRCAVSNSNLVCIWGVTLGIRDEVSDIIEHMSCSAPNRDIDSPRRAHNYPSKYVSPSPSRLTTEQP